ncbi:uncharacterized protein METZ01_LOCUS113626 [marine metagenome]|uniref:Uncharacterized protein n=1 Tax=marine metagenome TaxID=408172 RepID=A0A381X8A0_9ZZZZ
MSHIGNNADQQKYPVWWSSYLNLIALD